MSDKVKPLSELSKLAESLRAGGKRIVFTNGCFDLLHAGHVRYLSQAKALGDVLIVGLNSDESVRKLKGAGRPLTPQAQRAEILSGLFSVDYVVVFDEERPDGLIEALKPDVHTKGGDYSIDEIPEAKVVESYGGKVVILPEVEGASTTSLIERLKKEDK